MKFLFCLLILMLYLGVARCLPNPYGRGKSSLDQFSCAARAEKMCPMNLNHPSFNEHIHCIRRRRREFVVWCREYPDYYSKCVEDMDQYCYDLDYEETMSCLDDHHELLSYKCLSSLMFKQLHKSAGRDYGKYKDDHAKEADEHQSAMQEEPYDGEEF